MRLPAALVSFLVTVGAGSGVSAEVPTELNHSHVGIYGNVFDFCDFSVFKFYTPETEEQAQGYAKRVHEAYQRGKANLVLLYTFDRINYSRPTEEYLANTDKLLDALNLDEVHAVSLSEENVTWNNGLEVLNQLYDHLKQRYPGLTVYQWMTPYDVPDAKMRADGWIINPYGYGTQKSRKYLMKYLVEGKPVIACLNATTEEVSSWESSEDQVAVCREFNIPMFFLAVEPIHGDTLGWRDLDDPRIALWRSWVMEVRRQAKQMGTRGLPLPSADYSPGQPVEVAGDEANEYEYVETFDGVKFVDDARITGFLKMRWDGEREALDIVPQGDEGAAASLTYHLWSEFEMHDPQVRVAAQVNGASLSSVRVEMSKDAKKWVGLPAVVADGDGRIQYMNGPRNPEAFRGQNLWVRVSARGQAGGVQPFACRLEEIGIRGKCTPPKRRGVELKRWYVNHVIYTDDFEARRYLQVADIEGPEDLHWVRGEVGTHGVPEQRPVRVGLRYRFEAESPIKNIKVVIGNYAHWALGAHNEFGVSLDGRELLVSDTTRGKEREDGRYGGDVVLDLSGDERFSGVKEFFVHLNMLNEIEHETGWSNSVNKLTVEADLEE